MYRDMTAQEPSAQPRLAAIDVGSNTIRLTVAEVQNDDTYRILDEEREMVRLAEKLDRTGRLSDAAIERALAAIGKMKAIADGFQITELLAIATSELKFIPYIQLAINRDQRGERGRQRPRVHSGSHAAAQGPHRRDLGG